MAWKEIVAQYQEPSLPRSIWQMINTLVPYFLLWVAMYWSLGVSYWLTLALAALAGLFLVRVFIIFHDCGHGSFFKSKTANNAVGFISGMLTFTPYFHWRWEHSLHHSSCGDLERRGVGDIWTMTVEEYLNASRFKRFTYRLVRNPLILFVIAPLFLFLVYQRIPSLKASARERNSVWWMNLALAGTAFGMSLLIGFKAYLLIQLPAMMVAGTAGVWMFYIQHQFEDAYWEHHSNWDFADAALRGSSFYKLPKVLQWFSGNIGYHHVHHLSSRIPNYNLERCHNSHALFREVKPITLRQSLKSISLRLWDEHRRKLITWSELRRMRQHRA